MKKESATMRIYDKKRGDSLMDMLPCDFGEKQMVCAVGGGGKTSFVYTLTEELRRAGKRVIMTTTTHMRWPEDVLMVASDIEGLRRLLDEKGYAIAGTHPKGHRMTGVSDEVFAQMVDICDVVVIEADGAKRLPLKAPDLSHEPVVPAMTTLTVVIGGLNAIEKPIGEICFRLEQIQEILGNNLDRTVTPEDLSRVLVEGYQDAIPQQAPNSDILYIINQADTQERIQWAERAMDAYPQKPFLVSRFLNFGL
jgi:probable selenium-dependent hydroxylase accessory protein YqeC